MAEAKSVFEGKKIVVLSRGGWEYVERKKAKEAVAIVAVTEEGKLLLTEQDRPPVDSRVIDLPAGLVGDDGNADAEAAAKRELEEETGYTCAGVERLAGGPTSPGITSEIVTFYRAAGVRNKGKGGGVEGEEITVHEVAIDELPEWLRKREKGGALIDLKIWSALYFLLQSS
jgi:ADP-ribose pyrophosphatase